MAIYQNPEKIHETEVVDSIKLALEYFCQMEPYFFRNLSTSAHLNSYFQIDAHVQRQLLFLLSNKLLYKYITNEFFDITELVIDGVTLSCKD